MYIYIYMYIYVYICIYIYVQLVLCDTWFDYICVYIFIYYIDIYIYIYIIFIYIYIHSHTHTHIHIGDSDFGAPSLVQQLDAAMGEAQILKSSNTLATHCNTLATPVLGHLTLQNFCPGDYQCRDLPSWMMTNSNNDNTI